MKIVKKLVKKINKIPRARLMVPLVVIILLILLYFFKNLFVVALVNNKPIWRATLVSEMQKQTGKKTLNAIITRALIFQEAKKQNITVTDNEVNQEIKQLEEEISKQGQSLDQLLSSEGMTRNDFKEQIKIQKIFDKILGKNINISDKELDDYLRANKDFVPKGSKIEEVKTTLKKQLYQQKIQEKVQEWLKSLQDKAKIYYFIKF